MKGYRIQHKETKRGPITHSQEDGWVDKLVALLGDEGYWTDSVMLAQDGQYDHLIGYGLFACRTREGLSKFWGEPAIPKLLDAGFEIVEIEGNVMYENEYEICLKISK